MKVQYEVSISELKALLEIVQELARRAGLSETVTKSLFRQLNEKSFH